MYITFEWGDSKTKNEKFECTYVTMTLEPKSGSEHFDNLAPELIKVIIKTKIAQDPISKIFSFAKEQHNKAAKEGVGTIRIYPDRTAQAMVQEISFSRAWIGRIEETLRPADNEFNFTIDIYASNVTASKIAFEHHDRGPVVGQDTEMA